MFVLASRKILLCFGLTFSNNKECFKIFLEKSIKGTDLGSNLCLSLVLQNVKVEFPEQTPIRLCKQKSFFFAFCDQNPATILHCPILILLDKRRPGTACFAPSQFGKNALLNIENVFPSKNTLFQPFCFLFTMFKKFLIFFKKDFLLKTEEIFQKNTTLYAF